MFFHRGCERWVYLPALSPPELRAIKGANKPTSLLTTLASNRYQAMPNYGLYWSGRLTRRR
eukprot:5298258-Pyramimonas_sp.AAC.1